MVLPQDEQEILIIINNSDIINKKTKLSTPFEWILQEDRIWLGELFDWNKKWMKDEKRYYYFVSFPWSNNRWLSQSINPQIKKIKLPKWIEWTSSS